MPADPSAEQISQEFQQICRTFERRADLYWGKLPQEELESNLRQEESRESPDALRAVILRLRLAKELIEFGRLDDAL
jgi:hypothetical protein